jgi:hypothetical protein
MKKLLLTILMLLFINFSISATEHHPDCDDTKGACSCAADMDTTETKPVKKKPKTKTWLEALCDYLCTLV